MKNVMESVPFWQVGAVCVVVFWIFIARSLQLTPRIRAIVQPLVIRQVQKGVPIVLHLQRNQHPYYDLLLAATSFLVSIEFYTGFIPLLFWSGHPWLGRQMSVLMAFCMYIGNCVKDLVSAPRPPSPPVRRYISTASEENSSMEFGLPSSHTINTICLSLYLLWYLLRHLDEVGITAFWMTALTLSAVSVLVAYGRIYLGMHSPVDIAAGVTIGISLLIFWCFIEEYVDFFIMQGTNVICFWTSISLLLLVAYPTPAHPTPSFGDHTAFNGVVLGIVSASNRMKDYPSPTEVLSLGISSGSFLLMKRFLVGMPIVLMAKAISKSLAILMLPSICAWAGVCIQSSSYLPKLHGQATKDHKQKVAHSKAEDHLELNKIYKSVARIYEEPLDIDTGIRLFQYFMMGWSVVEVAPLLFKHLNI